MNISQILRRKLRFFIREFNENTCLPGFKYTSKLKSTKGKIIWYVATVLMTALCFYLIVLQYWRFSNNLTQLSFESNGYPVWKSPFPAITICNVNAVHRNQTVRIANILLQYGFTKLQTENFFKNLNKLVACNNCVTPIGADFDLKLYSKMLEVLEGNDYTTHRLMAELAQPCSSMLKRCTWNRKDVQCSMLFQQVMSTNGYCCSFNYNELHDISDLSKDEYYHFYSAGVGTGYGLEIVLDPEEDQYMSTIKPFVGFYESVFFQLYNDSRNVQQYISSRNVLVHPDHDIPAVLGKGTALEQGKVLFGGIDIEIIQSNWDVKYLRPDQRNCFFMNEHRLELTRLYTHNNCLYNCRKNVIQKVCNCVPFYFQTMLKEKLCTLSEAQCLIENRAIYGNVIIINNENGVLSKRVLRRTSKTASSCYCLENCDVTSFDVQFEVMNSTDFDYYSPNPKTTVVNLYYNKIAGSKTARQVVYTWDFLLALVGGIFAFCISGSILFLIELMYLVVLTVFHRENNA